MNPIMQMIQMARGGRNPIGMIQSMSGSNLQAAQLMRMVQGKNPQQLRQMCENMCRERGTTMEQMAQSLGIPMR